MRITEIEVFSYNDLSDKAKQKSYEHWLRDTLQFECPLSKPFDDLVLCIEKYSGLKLVNLDIDADFNYRFKTDYNAPFSDDWYKDERLALTGVRAAKEALNIYYRLASYKQMQCKLIDNGKDVIRYIDFVGDNHDLIQKSKTSRLSAFSKRKETINNYQNSDVFLKALYDSIVQNTNRKFTLKEHINTAFRALICNLIQGMRYMQSFEYFKSIADDFEYFENGDIYGLYCFEVS